MFFAEVQYLFGRIVPILRRSPVFTSGFAEILTWSDSSDRTSQSAWTRWSYSGKGVCGAPLSGSSVRCRINVIVVLARLLVVCCNRELRKNRNRIATGQQVYSGGQSVQRLFASGTGKRRPPAETIQARRSNLSHVIYAPATPYASASTRRIEMTCWKRT